MHNNHTTTQGGKQISLINHLSAGLRSDWYISINRAATFFNVSPEVKCDYLQRYNQSYQL